MATNPKAASSAMTPATPPESPPRVRTAAGELVLGERLGRGGEGTVYAVINRPELAAKIYHQPLSPDKVAKLQVMVELNSLNLEGLTAWPLELLASLDPPDLGEQSVGFIMPRIAARTRNRQSALGKLFLRLRGL